MVYIISQQIFFQIVNRQSSSSSIRTRSLERPACSFSGKRTESPATQQGSSDSGTKAPAMVRDSETTLICRIVSYFCSRKVLQRS
jgi:hypothetical protein